MSELDRRLQQPPPGQGTSYSSRAAGGLSNEERTRRNQEQADPMNAWHDSQEADVWPDSPGEREVDEALAAGREIEEALAAEDEEEPSQPEPDYIQNIIEDEWRDMEESLNELTQRGVLTADAAERLVHTATLVYRGGKCPQVTLDEVDLEDTEGIARMDVVVRGPEGSGGFAAWHITGSARRNISRVMENNPEARKHWKEPTAEAEDAAEEEAEEEMVESRG